MSGRARDAQIGANVAALRGSMSQQALADAMRQRGRKWHQATVWGVEAGNRPLRFSEADEVSAILGVSIDDLLATPAEAATPAPVTLTEFLLARIAEDEADWRAPRGARECEAKRRIALRNDRLERAAEEDPTSVELTWHAQGALEAALSLAAIYAGHRDYRDEWRA